MLGMPYRSKDVSPRFFNLKVAMFSRKESTRCCWVQQYEDKELHALHDEDTPKT